MKIILQNLIINNFKGIKALSIDFSTGQTNIYAANEAGKTTISDAWHWLLTGKNSIDQKDFNIKNTVNTDLNRSDHEVTGILLADGAPVTLKKIFREKWQKKRGEQLAEFTGNETLYYCNDVPLSQTEYQNKINGLLPESVLKMITNPLFFNSNTNNWGWQKRREVLMAIAGSINDHDIFQAIENENNKAGMQNLQYIISTGKSLIEYKREIASRKKKLKDDLSAIPTRIDEIIRGLPEVFDYPSIEKKIDFLNNQLKDLDIVIADKNKALQKDHQAIQERQNKIHELTTRRNQISFEAGARIREKQNEATAKKNELTNEIARLERDISAKRMLISQTKTRKETTQQEIESLREKWETINVSEIVFDKHAFECPTCKRAFEAINIEETKSTMAQNFNKNKVTKLEEINVQGGQLTEAMASYDQLIAETENIITGVANELDLTNKSFACLAGQQIDVRSVDTILADNDEYIQLGTDISRLQSQNNVTTTVDNSEIIAEKNTVAVEIDTLKRQLNSKDTLAKSNGRIEELKTEENTLAQQLADLEKTEFMIEDFNRSKMDIMESRINGKFDHVTFKLFDLQINGGEVETCETMYKEVPFSDLNTAGKIWAGIDIINALSKHYQVQAPIFLDNRESVSKIPTTRTQVINLIVSPADTVIRVVAIEHELIEA